MGVPHFDWINSVPNNGLIRYLGILNIERIFPTSPEALKDILTSHCYDFPKFPGFLGLMERILEQGLLNCEGNDHKFQRKMLIPAFQNRHVMSLVPIFWSKSTELVSNLISIDKTNNGVDIPTVKIQRWCSRGHFGHDRTRRIWT